MPEVTRKDFLRTVAAGLAATCLPGSVMAATTKQLAAKVTVEDLKVAAKVAGVEFAEDDLKATISDVNELRDGFTSLRAAANDYSLTPGMDWRMVEVSQLPAKPVVSVKPRRVDVKTLPTEYAFLSVVELGALLRAKKTTSVQLTTYFLNRLKTYSPKLLCVVELCEERALQEAKAADDLSQKGKWLGPLHGIPYGVKDLFDVAGYHSSWGVETMKDNLADEDCDVVRNLSAKGAVICGKLSLGSLAQGDVWWKGRTNSPWDPKIGSSGSSAGSGSAVGGGLLPFAIGTETSGSIVSPAHNCRITGLRPSFGSIGRAGAMALCWSLDKAGPLCRNAEDCAIVLSQLVCGTSQDRALVQRGLDYKSGVDVSKLKVGYLVTNAADLKKPVDPQSKPWLAALASMGVKFEPVFLPDGEPAMYAILYAECGAAFEAFTRSADIEPFEKYSTWPATFRAARFIPAVEYIQADRVRHRLAETYSDILSKYDVVIADDRVYPRVYELNATGHPQILVPFGVDERGRARSFSIIGKAWSEATLCAVAWEVQKKTGYHLLKPDMEQWRGPREPQAVPQRYARHTDDSLRHVL